MIRNHKYNDQEKKDKHTMSNQILHRKLKIGHINPTKNGGHLKCSGKLSVSCSTCGSSHVTYGKNLVINHKREEDRV